MITITVHWAMGITLTSPILASPYTSDTRGFGDMFIVDSDFMQVLSSLLILENGNDKLHRVHNRRILVILNA